MSRWYALETHEVIRLVIVVLNAILGFTQEHRAERASLFRASQPTSILAAEPRPERHAATKG